MDKQEFDTFFKPYSQNVDAANGLAFWKLSDALIHAIIQKHIPTSLSVDTTILDAGGGTGRWITELSRVYASRFVLFDLSEDMLGKAQTNFASAQLQDRTSMIHGSLTDMHAVADRSIDHIVSIYSPLSFIEETDRVAVELHRILKPGGVVLVMGHGYYNALASKINNYTAPAPELERLNADMRVKWAPYVPELSTFSKEYMETTFTQAGFASVATYGVPVFVQPGPEDFNPSNTEHSRISRALENPEFFETVFRIEMEHNAKPEVANRGMNIFSVFQKTL